MMVRAGLARAEEARSKGKPPEQRLSISAKDIALAVVNDKPDKRETVQQLAGRAYSATDLAFVKQMELLREAKTEHRHAGYLEEQPDRERDGPHAVDTLS